MAQIKVAPVRSGVAYAQVAGRLEGFSGEHRVRLEREGAQRFRFVTSGGAPVASAAVVLLQDTWERTTQFDQGKTGEDGSYEARWPATVDVARVRIASDGLQRDFLVRRPTVLAANPLTLVVDRGKSLRLRIIHAASGRPLPSARVTASTLAWPDRDSQARYYESIRASNMPKEVAAR
jgi:hypothetical protein